MSLSSPGSIFIWWVSQTKWLLSSYNQSILYWSQKTCTTVKYFLAGYVIKAHGYNYTQKIVNFCLAPSGNMNRLKAENGCLVHTSDISIRTRSIRKQNIISTLGLLKSKQPEFFFVLSFVRFLAYACTTILCYWLRRSLCHRLDFIPLFCLLFRLYAYAYARVWIRP